LLQFAIEHGPVEIVDIPIRNGDLPMKNGDLPIRNGDFPWFLVKVLDRYSIQTLGPRKGKA
jgi:hypothetical protein